MNFLKFIALSVSALALIADAAPTGQTFDTPYATPSAIDCTSDVSCALLNHVSVQTISYGGLVGSASYTWQGSCGGMPDTASYVRPTGARLGCFKVHGFTSLRPGVARLTPAQFGAKCDGTTDDTTAITALRTAAGSTRQIFVPASRGLCVISALNLDVANQTWTFAPGAGLLKKAASTGDLVTISANGVRIFGGTFDGNQTNAPGAARCIIGGGTGLILDGLTVRNCANDNIALYGAIQPILRHLNLSNAGIDGSGCAITAASCALLRVYGDGLSADALGPIIEDIVGDQSMHAASAHVQGVSIRGESSCAGHFYYGAEIHGLVLKFKPSITSTIANEDFDNFCIRDSNISDVRTYGGGEGFALGQVHNNNYVNSYIEASASEAIELNTGTGNIFTNTQIKSSCYGLAVGACGVWLDGLTAGVDARNTFTNLNIKAVAPFHGALFRAQYADGLVINGGNFTALAGSDRGATVIDLVSTHGATISNTILNGGGYVEGALGTTNSDHITTSSVTSKNMTSYGIRIEGTSD